MENLMFEVDANMFIERGLLPLIGTFIGAILAFCSQAYRDGKEKDQQQRDFIIAAYHSNFVNLNTLLTFKNVFLIDFSKEFYELKDFCSNFVNPMLPAQKLVYQKEWINKYHAIFLELAAGKDRGPCLLKQRWEKPVFLPLQEEELGFAARHKPAVLNMISRLKTSEELLHTELSHREKVANDASVFFEQQAAIAEGRADFIKQLFMTLLTAEGIIDTVNRSIALSVGLMAVLESYYFVQYGRPDFSVIKLSQENINLFPKMSDYNNFFGSEENTYIINLRLKYAQNTIDGHRELNFPTSVLPHTL